MARTPSNMLELGTSAPNFNLLDTVSGTHLQLADVSGSRGTVVMFICNHCPFVKHVNPKIAALGREYMAKGIGFVAISSNDVVHYPEDSPELMKQNALEEGYPFPYLYDASQEVAHAYQAACTPDFYLFDAALKLVYRGQLDASRPGNGIPVSGADLTAAMDALLAGTPINSDQKPSIGCNIKWFAQ